MNRYAQQVAKMDVRHHWRVRAVTFLGTATLIVVALWASDFRIGPFDAVHAWQRLSEWGHQEWQTSKDSRQAVAPQLPTTPVAVSNTPSDEPTKTLPGADSSISKTPQALVLVSTTRGRNTREGTARLGTHPENPQTYSAGAILANGARLFEIYDDRVVLERDGKRANLYLANSGKKSDSLLAMVGGEQPIKPFVPTHTEILTDYIRPSPVYDGQGRSECWERRSSSQCDGQLIHGYQVYAGQRSGVFSQLGLQNGDVILSLNDMNFTDPKQAMDMFHQLTEGVAMVATVERAASKSLTGGKGKVERVGLDGSLIVADQERIKNPPPVPTMPLGPTS